MEACCTCARLLSAVPLYSDKTEKLLPQDRRLECCGRVICGDCLLKNTRFETYCPYCQISSAPSSLLPQGLREPPSYSSLPPHPNLTLQSTAELPPPYASLPPSYSQKEKDPLSEKTRPAPPEPVLHFLDHNLDTLPSLSLRYAVPISDIRALNRLTSDHLLAARKTILIPPPPSSSSTPQPAVVSLSPVPVEGEEEEIRKNKIRRWMVATKIADYDVAVLYLEQNGYDLAGAVARFLEDEKWEAEHPMHGKKKGKGVLRIGARGAFPGRG
ncbi:hypothetical protein GE09DRAFT_1283739 [Coniochaeta sp. 2T2.1]|nr:hypothetical protein GE09DRAFT_1283739 [Coniochaeta sp. 2T2.1]